MMIRSRLFTAVLLASCALPALALDYPAASPYDHRIRSTTYNKGDVVQISTVIGIATHIEFEPGESYVTHVFGDSASYAFSQSANHVFIKPIAEQADTNLVIVTDRRTYNFRLIFQPTRETKALYTLTFVYPDTAQKKTQEELRKQSVADGFKQAPRGRYNINYDKAGDLDIAPVHVWDNNEFTYFKFPGNVDMPGIYLVDADGNESMVNRNTIGVSNHVYSVQKVSPKWRLRLGDRAATIYNNAFDPIGVENNSRTQSPTVKRVVVGGDE
ncbi:P-type conjugative transfer protein VirB9 [Pseudomonas syringae group genomosp. 3]|uniref:P-type conjugative transfer protein VirB9 n=1 Tax=Pseudomonas syringae group genomosp. 3 TaxID=251701 RepID=UPI000AB0A46E|nr:P-type conjugative transfer protein VirB9 [Pseudomonas syringae group genomosp. 3]